MANGSRFWRHIVNDHRSLRRTFDAAGLARIEQAIAEGEKTHGGQVVFAVESALPLSRVHHGVTPRARALEVFGLLRVWDTEHNNGVLIYVQVADKDVEIVADRGFEGRVTPAEWEAVCRLMEEHFRAGRFQAGSIAGVDAIANLLARHFPQAAGRPAAARTQLPDRPTLL
jgi:uncharacterized membrane protein